MVLIIIPKLYVFYYIKVLIIKMNEIEDYKNGEEHDKFREKLDNKMQRCETNWSRTSLPNEGRQQSQFIYKNNINNYN